jgi:hypothetical protein
MSKAQETAGQRSLSGFATGSPEVGSSPAGRGNCSVNFIELEAAFRRRRLVEFIRSRARPGDLGICYWCRRRVWWRSVAVPSVVRCGFCSPPAPGIAVEWLEGGPGTSAEVPGPGGRGLDRPGPPGAE